MLTTLIRRWRRANRKSLADIRSFSLDSTATSWKCYVQSPHKFTHIQSFHTKMWGRRAWKASKRKRDGEKEGATKSLAQQQITHIGTRKRKSASENLNYDCAKKTIWVRVHSMWPINWFVISLPSLFCIYYVAVTHTENDMMQNCLLFQSIISEPSKKNLIAFEIYFIRPQESWDQEKKL